jgi:hypothetical protein
VAVAGDLVLVGNTNHDSAKLEFGPGSVVVMSEATGDVLNTVPTSARNPQDLAVWGDRVLVLCTGATRFLPGETLNVALEDGALDELPLEGLDKAQAPWRSLPLPRAVGDDTVGGMLSVAVVAEGRYAFLGSGLSPVLYKVDLQAWELVRGPNNPLRLHDDVPGNDTVVLAPHPSGELLAASFNTGRLYRIDPFTDEQLGPPVKLAGTGDLEGPVDLVVMPGRVPDVFALLALANAVSAWDSAQPELAADARFAGTDAVGNALVGAWPHLFVVSSGANHIQRINVATGESTRPYVALPVGSNPFAMALSPEGAPRAWVTLLLWDGVAVVNLDTGLVERIVR